MDNIRKIKFTNGHVTEYIYSPSRKNLRTIHRTAVANITVLIGCALPLATANTLFSDCTDYIGNFELDSGLWHKYYFDGGYCCIFSGKTNAREQRICRGNYNVYGRTRLENRKCRIFECMGTCTNKYQKRENKT